MYRTTWEPNAIAWGVAPIRALQRAGANYRSRSTDPGVAQGARDELRGLDAAIRDHNNGSYAWPNAAATCGT
jgi:hypothetical protein